MINEHCRQSIVVFTKLFECIYKFSAILKILKSARRSEAPFAVTSHLGPSLVLHPRFFLARGSERLGLGCHLPKHFEATGGKFVCACATFCAV